MKYTHLILSLLILAGCSQKPAAVKKYYRLELPSQQLQTSKQHPSALWIKKPEAHSILGNRPMVATDAAGALQQLSHHAWIESPKILIHELLRQQLQNQWQMTYSKRPKSEEYHQLHSRILAFEKNNNQALIRIEFTLYDMYMEQVNHQTIASKQTIQGDDYAAFATAMSQALQTVIAQLELTP